KAGIDQQQDQHQGDRNGYRQPTCGLLRVLELTSPRDEISRGHLDLLFHRFLSVLYKAAYVAVGYVTLNHDPAQGIFTVDNGVAGGKLKSSQLAERNA